ncbi:hypothetical protein KM043_013533 [Ampulex compressa]|nr:hypothetical protein KM043_013533 [Ampulex compressa]
MPPAMCHPHRNDASLQRRSSKPRALKTSRSASLEARRSHGIEGASRAGAFSPEDAGIIGGKGEICLEQRPKRAAPISARVLSLDRKFVLASLSRSCHSCSVAQIANTDNGASNGSLARNSRAKGQSPRQYSKDSTNASFSTFEEKDPPSYAQMIANYSESVYIKTSPGVLSDDLSASIGNVTRRSPFSTLSTIASTDSTVHRDGKTQNSITRTSAIAVLDEGDMEIGKKPKEQQAAQNTEALIAQRTNKKTSDDGGTSSNPTEAPRTYAKMIADYSNTMDFCCVPNPAEKSYICKCVSRQTPCENLSPYPLDKRSNCRTKTTVSQSGNASHPMNQSNATMEVDTSKQDWLKKVENVIKDLRNVTVKRETRLAKTAPRTKDANPPEPEDTRIPWFDRVVKANKRRTNETETSRKISPSSNNPSADPKKHSDAWKHDSLQKYKPDINATNRSFSERLNRRSRSTSSKKDSSQTSSTTQEPRVELRMAPSNKESIVSVNVDNVSRRALDLRNPDAKELSVIVHSKRNENSRTNVDHESGLSSKSQEAAKFSKQEISGHGSLRVSISEDFVPVKRLEFSINGEPVSEVRSITARTEKLEVVSSLDKFEVRVPFTRAQASNQRAKNLTNLASNADSVLNIQISAKFQQSRAEGNVDLRGETRTVSNPKSAEASNVVNRVYRASDRIDGNRFGAQVGNDIRETVVRESPIFAKHEPEHRLEARNRAETTASESNWSSTPDNVKVVEHVDGSPKGTATVKQMSGSSTSIGSGNATNPSDQRTPSNMIPWWSSEDSFKRIKRKGNIKQAVAIMSEKKLAENPKEAQPLVKVTPPRSKDAFKLAAVAGKQPHSSKLATPSEAKSGPTSGKKFPKQGETIDTSTSDKVSSPKPMEKWRWFQPIANNPSVAEVEETRRNESSRDVKITKGDSKDYDNSISKEKQSDFISPSNAVNEHKQHPSKNISKSSANTGTTATAKDERKPTHDIKSNASNASKTRAVSDTDRASFPHLSQSPKGTNDGEGKTASQTRSEDTKSVKPAERSSNRSRSIKIDAAQREDPSTAGKPSIPKGAKQRLEETNARKESDDRKHYNANADASVTSAEYHKDATGKIVKNESASEALSEPISPRGKKKQQDIRVESNARNKRQSLTAKVRAEERDLISGRIEKEQRERASKKTRPADDAAKPRMKAIIESMRPIEKKKDGTLIDYGVKLPSRKGLNAGGKVSPDRSRVTIEINEECEV